MNYLRTFVKNVEDKFNKYWREAPMTFCLAVALDPRIKLSGVKKILEEINNNMAT